MIYDVQKKWLVTATTRLRPWPLKSQITQGLIGHRSQVIGAAFSSEFNEIVSVDQDGVVCSWSVFSGKMRFRFENAHPGVR